jgi:hypothetical protein
VLLVSVDVIGDHLAEVNANHLTCFQDVTQQLVLVLAALLRL